MKFTVLTLFPEYFKTPVSSSLIGKAIDAGVLHFEAINLRDFSDNKHKTVDDRPYGGGAGMVMMPTVIQSAVEKIKTGTRARYIYLSPQGKKLTAKKARELAKEEELVLLCGHYEGIDERALEKYFTEEISIGDYVLTGGEPAALIVMEAVSRFVPGVIGESASVDNDSLEENGVEMIPGGLKAPVYTRPQNFNGVEVPAVLLSGNHAEIAKWRREKSLEATQRKRPDLLKDKK